MKDNTRIGIIVLALVMLVALSVSLGRMTAMDDTKFTLKTYTGVGSGVYKHGTIVKVDADGTPTIVGHLDDDTGKDYPGTVQIEEVK